MQHPVFEPTSASGPSSPKRPRVLIRSTRLHRARWIVGLLTACLLATGLSAQSPATAAADAAEFGRLVKLAPFVVQGEQLTISIHARSKRDRRYAEAFARQVITVVYESVTRETGKGLVIIGEKREPHPIVVFRRFLALADAGKLDPAIAARGPELFAMLNRWQEDAGEGESAGAGDSREVDLEFEKIVTALPLPLEGMGAKLYQLAWAEDFDDARVEAKLQGLRAGDLERRDLFAHFDWVFYLPPKGAFDRVLDDLIADALKEEDMGFVARTAVKGVMLVVKPKIRQAIEALRRGLMFLTVVRARTTFPEEDTNALTVAYIEAMLPGETSHRGSEHDRAVAAIKRQLSRNAEKAADGSAACAGSDTESAEPAGPSSE